MAPYVLIERGVKSHWAEHYDAKCKPGQCAPFAGRSFIAVHLTFQMYIHSTPTPGPALNLKAFFGRLSEIVLAPLPPNLALAPRDTQALCKGLLGAGGGLFAGGHDKYLVFACLGLAVVAGTTYALSRAAAGGGRGDGSGRGSGGGGGGRKKPPGGGPPTYTPVIGDETASAAAAAASAAGNGFGGADEGKLPFSPTAVKGGATTGGARTRKSAMGGGGGGVAAASARGLAASVSSSPEAEEPRRSSARRTSGRQPRGKQE